MNGNRNGGSSKSGILAILLVILLVICGAEGVFSYKLISDNRKLSGQLSEAEEENTALKDENKALKKENKELKSNAEASEDAAVEAGDDTAAADGDGQAKVVLNDAAAGTDAEASSGTSRSDALKTEQEGDAEAAADPAEEAKEEQKTEVTPGSAVMDLEPGTVIDMVDESNLSAYFGMRDIEVGGSVYNRIYGQSYRDNPNIQLSQLKYLKMIHWNFAHQPQVGEMIVNAAISDDVIHVFTELFQVGYEVQSMYLIDNYWTGDGDSSDTASINVNNTSAFCYRLITGGSGLSNHAYGCAIDINPQQNPYVWHTGSGLAWTHDNASPYVDRSCGDPHVIVEGDDCWSIFIKYGFSWGGSWSDPIDYQHFEKQTAG